MSVAKLYIGDALSVLKTLPADSVDLVCTSPPYLSLRSYLDPEHPDKAAELGAGQTPADFIDALLDITEELRRVLKPQGSLCLELGDTMSGSGGAGGDYNEGGIRAGQPKFRQDFAGSAGRVGLDRNDKGFTGRRSAGRSAGGNGFPLAKSLCMIPESYRWALAYGRNPFNGRPTPTWRVRNVVRHFRPNPMPGELTDRWRAATSDWAVCCTGTSRYFDLDSVRTEVTKTPGTRTVGMAAAGRPEKRRPNNNEAGTPPLDWYQDDDDLQWKDRAGIILPTGGYPGAHHATFSPRLIQRFIECMCPAGGVVLDPFAGSGTVGAVATGHGRDALLIELDARNIGLIEGRVGMFLELAS